MGIVRGTNTLVKPAASLLEGTGVLVGAAAHEVCSGKPSPEVCQQVSEIFNAVANSPPVQKYIQGRNLLAGYLNGQFGVPRHLTVRTLDDLISVEAGVLLGKGGDFLRRELPRALAAPPKRYGIQRFSKQDRAICYKGADPVQASGLLSSHRSHCAGNPEVRSRTGL